jgi:hypothetical protein
MRTAVLGALVGAGLVMAAVGATPEGSNVFAQRTEAYTSATPERELIALSETVDRQYQQVILIDPRERAMSVYHVDLTSGAVKLQCVRRIHWDLQMEYFNGTGLTPQEIRSMLESR